MRLVLDTNVIVSGFYQAKGPSARILAMVALGAVRVLYSAAILDEYRDVLPRRKFRFDPRKVAAFLAQIEGEGERVTPGAGARPALPDPDDEPFAEAARAGKADALVTGNARHYPAELGLRVLTPRQALVALEGGRL